MANNRLKGISLRTLNDLNLGLWLGEIRSEKTIGYTFYLGTPLTRVALDSARTLDLIIAGSTFCEEQLHSEGITQTNTIIQGINPRIFNPCCNSKSLLKDRFVIFSGGKFEFRKGQDIVMRAFKIFSDKHPDALLVNSWFNLWEFSLNTMAASDLIDFKFNAESYMTSMNTLFHINGIDPGRVITLPIKPPPLLANIFKNTDIGLFPNRCEGGTNLMLMEYMACGKPVIAASRTGHADIIRNDNAFNLVNCGRVAGGSPGFAGWVEPDIDEIVSALERAYDDTDLCRQKGKAAGEFLSGLTWEKAALKFYKAAEGFI